MARQVAEIFTEVIVAPGVRRRRGRGAAGARRTSGCCVAPALRTPAPAELRPVTGGVLVQIADRVDAPGDDPANWQLATGEAADDGLLRRPRVRLAGAAAR